MELTDAHRAKAEKQLEIVHQAQIYFWDAISDLESMLSIEIDSTVDLAGVTVEGLLDEYGSDDEEHDQDVRIKQTGRA